MSLLSVEVLPQAKIVKRDGKIYFEGYKWKNLFSSVEKGVEVVCEVIYNETKMSMILVIAEEI